MLEPQAEDGLYGAPRMRKHAVGMQNAADTL